MIKYLLDWGNLYLAHFGAWVTFILMLALYKQGVPDNPELIKFLKTTFIIAFVGSIFSSHSHLHYMNYIINKVGQ